MYIQARVLLEEWTVADLMWVLPESVLKKAPAALSGLELAWEPALAPGLEAGAGAGALELAWEVPA